MITEKICSKCEKLLPIANFCIDNQKKDGYSCACKVCKNVKYEIDLSITHKICSICNVDKEIVQFPIDRQSPNGTNPRCKSCRHQHYVENKEHTNEVAKIWAKENGDRRREKNREREQKKRDNKHPDIIMDNISRRIRGFTTNKTKNTVDYLGCSKEEFWKHLENQFVQGMTLDNYGTRWVMDHIIPVSHFNPNIYEDLYKCFHFTNYQPLSPTDNGASKKWDKLPPDYGDRVWIGRQYGWGFHSDLENLTISF